MVTTRRVVAAALAWGALFGATTLHAQEPVEASVDRGRRGLEPDRLVDARRVLATERVRDGLRWGRLRRCGRPGLDLSGRVTGSREGGEQREQRDERAGREERASHRERRLDGIAHPRQ